MEVKIALVQRKLPRSRVKLYDNDIIKYRKFRRVV